MVLESWFSTTFLASQSEGDDCCPWPSEWLSWTTKPKQRWRHLIGTISSDGPMAKRSLRASQISRKEAIMRIQCMKSMRDTMMRTVSHECITTYGPPSTSPSSNRSSAILVDSSTRSDVRWLVDLTPISRQDILLTSITHCSQLCPSQLDSVHDCSTTFPRNLQKRKNSGVDGTTTTLASQVSAPVCTLTRMATRFLPLN